MKRTSYSLALRIAVLIEEHSEEEISQALAILKKVGNHSDILEYFKKSNRKPSTGSSDRRITTKTKPIDQVTSKAVTELEKIDRKKFSLLHDFDHLIRKGDVLPTNEAVRRFGEEVSKEFRARSSKRDNISELMSVMSTLSVDEIEKYVLRAARESSVRRRSEYNNLATYIIKGNK